MDKREKDIRELAHQIEILIIEKNQPPEITEIALSFVWVVYLLNWKISKKDFMNRLSTLLEHYYKEFEKGNSQKDEG